MWANVLQGRMNCINLTSLEKLQILFANTDGRPKQLVEDYLTNVTPESASSALQTVWNTLEEGYGNKMASAQILIDRIEKLPFVHSVDDADAITRMLDACRNAVYSRSSSPQLQWLNTYEGIRMLTEKLSDSLRSRWRTME